MVDQNDDDGRITITDLNSGESLEDATSPKDTFWENPAGNVDTTVTVNFDTGEGTYTVHTFSFAVKGSDTFKVVFEKPDGTTSEVPEVCKIVFLLLLD